MSTMVLARQAQFSFLALTTMLFVAGCSGSSGPTSVSLSSSSTQTDQGQTIQIMATLTNDSSGQGVTWSLVGPGTLSMQGSNAATYNAPSSVPSPQTATVTATSRANATKTASIQLTVNPPPQISLLQSLANGRTGATYSQNIAVSGGSPPFTWSLQIGAVPNGLNLNPSTGVISGTPTGGGTWYFWARATDAAGLSADDPFLSLEINSNSLPGNPVPLVYQPLLPDAVAPGGPSFTLTVNGTGFVSGATISFNNTALPTTFVNNRQLTAMVSSSNIAAAGTASITVSNPTPGGGLSNAVYFPIATPETTVSFSNAPGSPIPPIIRADTPGSLVAGDFNADGKTDLSIAYTVRVVTLLGTGGGTFASAPASPLLLQYPPWDTLGTPYAGAMVLGDFDNSGNLGLAVAGFQSSDATILLGKGNGSFAPSATPTYIENMPTAALASGDFNGDGNLDLAAVGENNGLAVVVLLGYGDGEFTPVPSSPFGISSATTSIAVGDFNGDGKLDLALAGASLPGGPAALTILLGNGDGTFTQAPGSPAPIGSGQNAMVVGDLNGDGKLDIAVASSSDNSVRVLLGNGDGTFAQAPGSPITVGTTPYAVGLGDFTGNGKLSIAVANYGDNTLTLLLGNGDGTFTQAPGSPIPLGKGPVALAVGDFNGSGRLGLAVSNAGDFTVSILVQQ